MIKIVMGFRLRVSLDTDVFHWALTRFIGHFVFHPSHDERTYRKDFSEAMDVVSYNYQEPYYKLDREEFPDRIILGGECYSYFRGKVRDESLDIDPGKDHWQWPHLAAHWNFAQYTGHVIKVETVTNCETVELILNGHSFGVRKSADYPIARVRFRNLVMASCTCVCALVL